MHSVREFGRSEERDRAGWWGGAKRYSQKVSCNNGGQRRKAAAFNADMFVLTACSKWGIDWSQRIGFYFALWLLLLHPQWENKTHKKRSGWWGSTDSKPAVVESLLCFSSLCFSFVCSCTSFFITYHSLVLLGEFQIGVVLFFFLFLKSSKSQFLAFSLILWCFDSFLGMPLNLGFASLVGLRLGVLLNLNWNPQIMGPWRIIC